MRYQVLISAPTQQNFALFLVCLCRVTAPVPPYKVEETEEERVRPPGIQSVRLQDAESRRFGSSAGSGVLLDPPGDAHAPRTAPHHPGELQPGAGETTSQLLRSEDKKEADGTGATFWAQKDPMNDSEAQNLVAFVVFFVESCVCFSKLGLNEGG